MSKATRNLRNCPAVGKEITSRECGENRGSQYACPADCPHNPWAPENYALGLEIDDRLSRKIMERANREGLRRDTGARSFNESMQDTNAYWCFRFYFERDAEGHTFVERWEKKRFQDLVNDERVLLGHLAAMRPVVIEIRRIIDDESFEAVDLLGDPEEVLLFRDRSMASHAVRFSTYLAWLARLPHYHRLIGIAIDPPEVQDLTPDAVVREVARHLGAPDDDAALIPWLAGNFGRICEAFTATGAAMRRRTFEQLDAKYYKTLYRPLSSLAACSGRIAKRDDAVRDDLSDEERMEGFTESFTWVETASKGDPAQGELPAIAMPGPVEGRAILGRSLLGPDRIRLEASSTARNVPLRSRFEKALAGMIEFTGERVEDLAAQLFKKEKPFDASLVPPALLARARQISLQTSLTPASSPGVSTKESTADLMRRYHERWMDIQSPALEGHTPREAAKDPVLRPKLVLLAKTLVRSTDQNNRRDGTEEDINWLLEELGLREIIFDPPPVQALEQGDSEDDDFDDNGDFDDEPFIDYPEPPPAPMSEREFERRLKALEKRHPSMVGALDEFYEVAPDVLEVTSMLLGDDLGEKGIAVLLAAVVQAYFILVPPGQSRFILDDLRLEDRLFEAQEDFLKLLSKPEADFGENCTKYFESARQPVILGVCAQVIFDAAEDLSAQNNIHPKDVPLMLSYLKALVDELDCAVGAWKG